MGIIWYFIPFFCFLVKIKRRFSVTKRHFRKLKRRFVLMKCRLGKITLFFEKMK
jgi:hypothetical protein